MKFLISNIRDGILMHTGEWPNWTPSDPMVTFPPIEIPTLLHPCGPLFLTMHEMMPYRLPESHWWWSFQSLFPQGGLQ